MTDFRAKSPSLPGYFFCNMQRFIYDYQPFTIMDWLKTSSWGVVQRNGKEELVIIDDGMDEDVLMKHYY